MLRSPIFALGSLGVGNRPAADSHRTIGISATPPSLWPGYELQKYLLRSTGRLNYSVVKEHMENLRKLGFQKIGFYIRAIEKGQKITLYNNFP